MAQIRKEIPSGAINGVNKVFVLANTPEFIDDIFMDGVIYVSYTLSGNVLTLVDAPELSLYVDYETATGGTPVTSTVTFGDIKSKVWNLLGQTPNSTLFSSSVISDEVNALCQEIWRGRVTNLLNPTQIFRAGKLWFTEGRTTIRIQGGSALTANLEIGDTTASCETSGLLGAGYVEIGGDIISYTSVTSTELAGVSGQTIEHYESEKIIQLYEMPTNLEKIIKVEKIIRGSQSREAEIPLDNTDSYSIYYQIWRTGTKQLLKIVGLQEADLVTISYTLKYTDMNNDSDVCSIPDKYGITVIAQIAAGNLAYNKSMPNAQGILNMGYGRLQNMFQFFTNETTVIKQSIGAKPFGFRTIRRY